MSNDVLFGLVYIDIVFATRVAPVCVSSFVWKSLFCFTKRAVVWLVLVGLDIFFDDFELPAFTRFLQQNWEGGSLEHFDWEHFWEQSGAPWEHLGALGSTVGALGSTWEHFWEHFSKNT